MSERWAWRNPRTRQVLPERYKTREEAMEYMPRANTWELVRVTESYTESVASLRRAS